MKIGIINASPFYVDADGISYISADEMKSLSQWFHLFDEVTLFKPELGNRDKPSGWEALDVKIKVVRLCRSDESLGKKILAIKAIRPQMTGYDLFYYRLPNYEALTFWKKQPQETPYFVELHGDMESAVMSGNHPWIVKKIVSKVLLYYLRKMASSSKFTLSIGPALLDKYVYSSIPTYVTTNHLLLEKDYPEDIPERNISKVLNILFVGHIHDRKGLRFLFKALAKLKQQNIPFQMNLAGKGELKSYLEDYAMKNDFIEQVSFLGQIKHGEELFDLYRQADLFILPSVAAEGVPRVIHEAMAFGCPVIATDIGSIKWQLSGHAGVLIEPNSSEAIYKAIMKIENDEDLRRILIKNGYEKSKLFSLENQEKGIHDFVRCQLKDIYTL